MTASVLVITSTFQAAGKNDSLSKYLCDFSEVPHKASNTSHWP